MEQTKQEQFITNCAIYGYKKDPENKYHWLIDEEAAAVVRRIFRLTIEGKGPYDIARILFEDKVETPAVYFGKQGKGIWKSKEEFSNPYNWSGYVVEAAAAVRRIFQLTIEGKGPYDIARTV